MLQYNTRMRVSEETYRAILNHSIQNCQTDCLWWIFHFYTTITVNKAPLTQSIQRVTLVNSKGYFNVNSGHVNFWGAKVFALVGTCQLSDEKETFLFNK